VAQGLLGRLVPNLQVFAVGLPGQILAGLALLSLLAGGMVAAWQDQLHAAFLSLPGL
jgi:flagellar biosynthesis protein FliR